MGQIEVNVIVCTDSRRCAYTQTDGRAALEILGSLQHLASEPGLEGRVQVTECQCIFGCTYGPRVDVARRWSGEKVIYGSIGGDAYITRRGLVQFHQIPGELRDIIYDNLPPG